ncbi:hypothetical protein [Streptomyces sp. NBC_01353]|nr:hypothetical protein [Streptomyces sp. NBC_01353]
MGAEVWRYIHLFSQPQVPVAATRRAAGLVMACRTFAMGWIQFGPALV